MSNTSWTHNNPFVSGGWDRENDGSSSPSTHSSQSSGSSGSNGSGHWVPAQSAFGVLPVAATPGALPPGLLGPPITFRFMASGNQTNLSLIGPNNRTCHRIRTTNTHTYISIQTGNIATVNWTGAEPVIEYGGRTYRASEYLRDARDAQHRRIKIMMVEGRELVWTHDERGFYIHPNGSLGQILGFVYNINGVEVKIVGNGLSSEMLNGIALAVVLMQGKMFVGLH